VKAHICCGTNTNVVTAIKIEDKHAADPAMLPALVDSTAKTFTMTRSVGGQGVQRQSMP